MKSIGIRLHESNVWWEIVAVGFDIHKLPRYCWGTHTKSDSEYIARSIAQDHGLIYVGEI